MSGLDDFAVEVAESVGCTVTEARWRLDAIINGYGRPPGALTVRDFYRPDWLPAVEADIARRCGERTVPR